MVSEVVEAALPPGVVEEVSPPGVVEEVSLQGVDVAALVGVGGAGGSEVDIEYSCFKFMIPPYLHTHFVTPCLVVEGICTGVAGLLNKGHGQSFVFCFFVLGRL